MADWRITLKAVDGKKQTVVVSAPDASQAQKMAWKAVGWDDGDVWNIEQLANTSYENGRQRAMNSIGEKMEEVGVENVCAEVENDLPATHRKTLIDEILAFQNKLGRGGYSISKLTEMPGEALRRLHQSLKDECAK